MYKRKELKDIEKALFIIDMNVGFCEEGNLADPTIKHIVPNIMQIARQILAAGEGLFIVNDKHTKDSTEFNRYFKHCDNEKESRTIKEIRIIEPYATGIFYKNSTCALFAAGLARTILMMKKLKQIIITGCCTDICILNFAIALRNFLDELNIDIEIIVPINAVETYHIPSIHDRKEYNERAYKVMEDGGITLVKEMKGVA